MITLRDDIKAWSSGPGFFTLNYRLVSDIILGKIFIGLLALLISETDLNGK